MNEPKAEQLIELKLPEKFRNTHLSVSRLKRYEECPQSFYLHYVKKPKEPSVASMPAEFGKLLHDTLECLFKWVVDEEFVGFLPQDKMMEFYQQAWSRSPISGIELYQEGLSILRAYLRRHPRVDHFDILDIEAEFNIQFEEFTVNGYIDRIDRVNDDTIRIVDYKSNRVMFTREEVDVDMQMSVYAVAAKKLHPWVQNIEFVFHMLRHEFHISTQRSVQQIEDAKSYVVALGRKTEMKQEYPARLNTNCGYCDHRASCETYRKALTNKVESILIDRTDLEEVAKLRERVANIAKLAYSRKRELDDILRAHLEHNDELFLAGHRYHLVHVSTTGYPLDKTIEKIARIVGKTKEEIASQIVSIDNKRLESFLEKLTEESKSKALLLKAELEVLAQKIPQAPRLYATKSAFGKRTKMVLPAAIAQNDGMLLPSGKEEAGDAS